LTTPAGETLNFYHSQRQLSYSRPTTSSRGAGASLTGKLSYIGGGHDNKQREHLPAARPSATSPTRCSTTTAVSAGR
jgi:hypothetical protein